MKDSLLYFFFHNTDDLFWFAETRSHGSQASLKLTIRQRTTLAPDFPASPSPGIVGVHYCTWLTALIFQSEPKKP